MIYYKNELDAIKNMSLYELIQLKKYYSNLININPIKENLDKCRDIEYEIKLKIN